MLCNPFLLGEGEGAKMPPSEKRFTSNQLDFESNISQKTSENMTVLKYEKLSEFWVF